MRPSGPSKKHQRRPGAQKYVAAVIAVAMTLGLSLALFDAVPPAPGALALTAVLAVSLLAGRGPGVVTTLLCAVGLDYFFYEPRYALDTNPATLAGVGCYVLISFVVGAATDWTREARLRAEAARETAETLHQQLRSAVEAGGMTAFTWEIGSGEVRQTGRLTAGSMDHTFGSIDERLVKVHPEDHESVRASVHGSLQRGLYRAEYRTIEPDGDVRWWLEQGRVTYDDAGKPLRLSGVTIDLTDREKAEAAQRRLAAIVESSDDAIVGHALDGTITSWNRGASQLYGYSAEEAVGRPVSFLMPLNAEDDMGAVLARVARGEHVEHYETVRIARDGRRLEVSLTVSPIRDREGRIVGASKVARDITERKLLERRLRDRTEQIQTQNEELDAQREELL
ncbi:MAG: todS, partial [Armatimonadetes bacterium]|nr:todS [Armatimonadota bacterium]